jgi:thiosulfate/3-mercaptopyruvate sulfurtransferase
VLVGRAAAAEAALPGPLVTAQWLHDHADGVTVIDIGDNAQRLTTTGHIAGALFVDFNTIREERTIDGVKLAAMMPTKESFEKVMETAGLDKGRTIVIAPVGDSVESLGMATRLLFQLKYFGEDKVAILNGGTNAWIGANYPVSTDPVSTRKGDWVATAERKELLATTDDVKAGLRDHATQLVDARPIAQFFGTMKSPVVKAAGHVEGARSFPPDAVTPPAGAARQFLNEKQYRAIFQQQGINPDQPSISYCNTGHYGSGAWFVAHEILNQKDAKLYAGSMNEWTNLNNPVVGLPQ